MTITENYSEWPRGLQTSFTDLERIASDWQNSDFVILAGCPAMGKTAFVLSLTKNMAIEHGYPVAFFSLDMSIAQLVRRLGTDGTVENGKLTDAPIYVDDTPCLSVSELQTKARQLVREKGIKFIIIDYLQLINGEESMPSSREEELRFISLSLKNLAKELNVPIVALLQLFPLKGGRQRRPQLCDLRESRIIVQDADILYFIHRPEHYRILEDEKGNPLIGLTEIIMVKHRNEVENELSQPFAKRKIKKFLLSMP